MGVLPLDDPRWSKLDTRSGRADWVPRWLRALRERPGDRATFADSWPDLCSEGTAWSAAFAATPYIADLAAAVPPTSRYDYVFFLGLVAMNTVGGQPKGGPFGMRRFLAPAHRAALRRALPLAIEVLHARLSAEETRQLLAGVAALKGSVVLGDYISRLHCGYVCPRCGAEVEGSAYVGETE